MPRGHASPKSTSTQYISLNQPADLLAAGEDMLTHGYFYVITGHTEAPPPENGVPAPPDAPGIIVRGIQLTRQVTLKHPSQSQVSAELGQVLILDDSGETITAVLSTDEFNERYKT